MNVAGPLLSALGLADTSGVLAAVWGAVASGDPTDASSFQAGSRKTFHGRLVAVVRSATAPGVVNVEVAVEGMAPQTLTLRTVAAR